MSKDNSTNRKLAANRYFVELDGDTFEVSTGGDHGDRFVVKHGKKQISFEVMQKEKPYELLVSKGSRLFPVSIEQTDGEMSVFYGCREAKVAVKTERDLLYEKYHEKMDLDDQELKVVSPLPGLVTKVQVTPGDTLKKGQSIVIIEAMKMENEIRAPRDCEVRELNVSEGKPIDKGHIIAVLE